MGKIMELKIKISLHADEFALKPIIETECRFNIENDETLDKIQELIRFIIAKQLRMDGIQGKGH